MIRVRRILTIPFGIVLLPLLLVTVVLLQVDDTFLTPKFYRDQLREVDIYRWALNDVATSALDEARELPPEKFGEELELDENPFVTSGLTTEDLVGSLNRALPPEWVQELVEQVLDGPATYVTGDRDEFTVTVQAGDQVVQIVEEAKTLLRQADAYGLLFEQIEIEIETALKTGELPLGIEVSSVRLVQSIQRIADRDWVEANVENVLDTVTPYAVGETDSFEIRLELDDRVEIALDEVKLLLREVDAYELLYDEVVEPLVSDNLGAVTALPFGIEVSSNEVMVALRQVAPPSWVQEQAEGIIDAAGSYVTKRSSELEIVVDITQNKADARRVLVETARNKFGAIVSDLPECTTLAQAAQVVASGLTEIPECMPGGETARDLVMVAFDTLSDQVENAVETLVLAQVPDRLSFTSEDLRSALSEVGASDNFELLEDARDVIGDGWSYTDADLRSDLIEWDGPDTVDILEEVRGFLADGWSTTEQDLRDSIGNPDGLIHVAVEAFTWQESRLEAFDDGRTWFKRARTFRLLVYLPVLLLLVAIGVLGGRTWMGRLGWAAGYLAVSALAIWIAFGPVYGVLAEDGIEKGHTEAVKSLHEAHEEVPDDFLQTKLLGIDKSFELLDSVADSFASGVVTKSAVLLVLGLAGTGAAIAWPLLWKPSRRDEAPASEGDTRGGVER